MPASTTIGALNVQVTAKADQFNAIMEDMARQAEAAGTKLHGAAEGAKHFAEQGEHAHAMSARMAMSFSHAGIALGEGGLTGGMHAATHALGHFALHAGAAATPIIALSVGANLLVEGWKKAAEEIEKAAEKMNGLHENIKKVDEAMKAGAEARAAAKLQTSGELGAAAERKGEEAAQHKDRIDAIKKQIKEQDDIIRENEEQQRKHDGMLGWLDENPTEKLRREADINLANKNKVELNRQAQEEQNKMFKAMGDKRRLEERKTAAEEGEDARDKLDADVERIAAEEKAAKKAAEEDKKRAALVKSIQAGTPEGRKQNIIDEARQRRAEVMDSFEAGQQRDAMLAMIDQGMEGELRHLAGMGHRENAISTAMDFGSTEAFRTVAEAGHESDVENAILQQNQKQNDHLQKIEEGIATPDMKIVWF
jgi:hypothetical protein